MGDEVEERLAYGWLDEPAAVDRAVAEYRRIGRQAFLRRHHFGEADKYFIRVDGYHLDAKAIGGVALNYQYPDMKPVNARDLVGNQGTLYRRLAALGYPVRQVARPRLLPERPGTGLASERLVPGALYTRKELRAIFSIKDATLDNGVFRPKGTSSVWLMVTEQKTSDRTAYHNSLDGDFLHWQGQTEGRTDPWVVEHRLRELELLVFYRQRKTEHPGAAFRYLGEFDYVSQKGANPTSFVLRRVDTTPLVSPPGEPADEDYDPASVQDERRRVLRAIADRKGQPKFRANLLAAYGHRCAITNCDVEGVLEAAHIHPYRGDLSHKMANGILLRADIHNLFDAFLLGIHPDTFKVVIAPQLQGTAYGELEGRKVLEHVPARLRPGRTVLLWRLNQMGL